MSDGHDRNYEAGLDREIDLKAIVWSVVGLTAIVLISAALMWFLSVGLRARLIAADPPPPVIPEAREQELPPEPRLQTTPEEDMRELRRHEDEILEGYAWTDEAAGVARVPIERAMDILVEREGGE